MFKKITTVFILCLPIFIFNSAYAQVEIIITDSIDVIDTEEEDETEEESLEFDSIIVESNGPYWDFLRPRDFTFDTSNAPANRYYNFWDTVVINPYKNDLKIMNDTVVLSLVTDGCGFHPPAIGDLSSTFGFRSWGRRAKFHFGVDVRMDVGDPVYAAFAGVVRIAKKSADYGYMVLIRHDNGLETLYAHFSQLLCYIGQHVTAGDIIGLAGSTGRSTGPHLHFEVRFKGEKINPNKLVHFPSGSLLSDSLQIDKSCFKHLYEVKSAKLKLKSPKYIKARKGDTLYKIAREYGVSVKRLARLNKISSKTKIKKGKRIRLR
jgi:murein DD-endopeptidase MepM/ murein hydrolase activator NlpD